MKKTAKAKLSKLFTLEIMINKNMNIESPFYYNLTECTISSKLALLAGFFLIIRTTKVQRKSNILGILFLNIMR